MYLYLYLYTCVRVCVLLSCFILSYLILSYLILSIYMCVCVSFYVCIFGMCFVIYNAANDWPSLPRHSSVVDLRFASARWDSIAKGGIGNAGVSFTRANDPVEVRPPPATHRVLSER